MLPADLVREFVIAGHWNLEKVRAMLIEHPSLLRATHEWGPGDTETAVQAAAHTGSRAVAEYLLAEGAPLDIGTAAMLGWRDEVEQFLAEDPSLIEARGAHGIPLMAFAALSGDVDLARLLADRGADAGMSFALSNAVTKGHVEMTRWLLEGDRCDLSWKNYEGKTPLEIARERGHDQVLALLQERETQFVWRPATDSRQANQ